MNYHEFQSSKTVLIGFLMTNQLCSR